MHESRGAAIRQRPLELLEREITELAAHIHAATCRWLALIAEFDEREGWGDWGCKSCAQWLSHTCALGTSAAREHVRVARRLAELPAIRGAFAEGELSYSQVRAITRVATPELEEQLLEIARHATAAELERVLRSYRGVLARELTRDDLEHGDRYVICEHDDDGSLLIHARLPAEEGAIVIGALEAAREAMRGDGEPSSEGRGVSAETSTSPPSNADALIVIAETLLESGCAERNPADTCQVVVHVDAATLSGTGEEAHAGACQLEHGEALHPETARRLACDASVVRILERDGRPLSLGRRTRSVPPALKRALRSRDATCRFPGCCQRRFLHAHHLEHWAHGGPTDLANLIHLCRYHHRLVHEGGYTVEVMTSGALCFKRPDGRPIPVVVAPQAGSSDRLRGDNRRRGVEPGPDTCTGLGSFDRLDLPLAIDSLVGLDPRLGEDEERVAAGGRPPRRPPA